MRAEATGVKCFSIEQLNGCGRPVASFDKRWAGKPECHP